MKNLALSINVLVCIVSLMFTLLYVMFFVNTGEFNNGVFATIGVSIYSYINIKATR
jgi:hypothetical protein